MDNSRLNFRAISPLSSPLSVQLGIDQFSQSFIHALQQLNNRYDHQLISSQASFNGEFFHIGGQQKNSRQYGSTESNSKDIRLMCWRPTNNSAIVFHVFANNIAVAEVDFAIESQPFIDDKDQWKIKQIEQSVQDSAFDTITKHISDFYQDLLTLSALFPSSLSYSKQHISAEISWIARTLLVNDNALKQAAMQQFLTDWLAKTNSPSDAQAMINGSKAYSLTWLNYAINSPEPVGEDPHIQIMVLCQYYYVLQEHCNSELRSAIEQAYAPKQEARIDKTLSNTRTASRLNQIAYFENIKFLSRPNRVLLEDILAGWQYNQLVENAERMIEVCDARLQEEDNKKRERSTVMTDFLLVTLSFFAVFELSLYLTEFSREMMSRPALDYNDNKSSFFLGVIAEIDADIMFSFGFGLTLLLILFYRYIKRH